MDHHRLASELIRKLRGKRSQAALSRRLSYRSNVVRTWEAGRRSCKTSTFMRMCEKSGVDRTRLLRALYREIPPALASAKWTSPAFVSLLLDDIRGATSIVAISKKAGINRYTIARWLSGAAEPNLPEFLQMLDATSFRMLDFVAAIVDPSQLSSVASSWLALESARRVAVKFPWSHAVLRVLELAEYRRMKNPAPSFIAQKLGIASEEVAECLELLARAGQIAKTGNHWVADEQRNIDTRSSAQDSRALRLWWAQVGADYIRREKSGLFSFNVFTVSNADHEVLKSLHLSYFRQLRSIVAQSTPAERVVVANVQLFELSGDEPAAS